MKRHWLNSTPVTAQLSVLFFIVSTEISSSIALGSQHRYRNGPKGLSTLDQNFVNDQFVKLTD